MLTYVAHADSEKYFCKKRKKRIDNFAGNENIAINKSLRPMRRNSVTVLRRYNFKLYPNKAQDAALERQTVLLARLWNAALEQREQASINLTERRLLECLRSPASVVGKYPRKKQSYVADDLQGPLRHISKYDQSRELKFIRAEDPEYAAMSSSSLELCVAALDDAFKAFYKRAKGGAGKSSGYPRYKASKPADKDWRSYHHDTIWHRDHLKGWRLDRSGKNFRIYAKGIPGTIKAGGEFPHVTTAGKRDRNTQHGVSTRSVTRKSKGKIVTKDRSFIGDIEIADMRIMRRDGRWFCSIAVRMEPRISGGNTPVKVEFDLIDEFATVKNVANGECLPGWEGGFYSSDEQISPEHQQDKQVFPADAAESGADDRLPGRSDQPSFPADAAESGADDREMFQSTADFQSVADTRYKNGSWRWRQSRKIIARRRAKEARRHKEALHLATTSLIRSCSEVELVCPPIKEFTQSARGNERHHGAAVKTVAMLNRHVLRQAPAAAIQMLEYKAAEAGIPFARTEPDDHHLAIGRELPAAVKANRKLSRQLRKGEGK